MIVTAPVRFASESEAAARSSALAIVAGVALCIGATGAGIVFFVKAVPAVNEANPIAQIGSKAQRAINILRAITVGEDLPGVNAHANPDDSDCIRTVNG